MVSQGIVGHQVMNNPTRSTPSRRSALLTRSAVGPSEPPAPAGNPVPLAFLPIDDIAPQPIDYLRRSGVPVQRYAYRALSDVGLGSPVIRYRIEHGDLRPATTLIAKWHEPDEGPALASLLQALWQNGFAAANLSIPEPLGDIPDRHILLQAEAVGEPLYNRLAALSERRAADACAMQGVRGAGRWLARLHALRDCALRARSPVEDAAQSIDKAQRHCAELAARFPAFADRFRQLAQSIGPRLADAPVQTFAPTHGDFHPKNVYIAGERVTVIDFDRFAYSRPERDLGYFIAQSMTMAYTAALRFEASAVWNAEFVAAYAAAAPAPDPITLGAYTGIAFLEVLFYRLVVRPVAAHAFLQDWLAQCERLLSEPLHA
jgi:Ser/Thr protein kinase RdoA (MazF antagonist)